MLSGSDIEEGCGRGHKQQPELQLQQQPLQQDGDEARQQQQLPQASYAALASSVAAFVYFQLYGCLSSFLMASTWWACVRVDYQNSTHWFLEVSCHCHRWHVAMVQSPRVSYVGVSHLTCGGVASSKISGPIAMPTLRPTILQVWSCCWCWWCCRPWALRGTFTAWAKRACCSSKNRVSKGANPT